jgi:hypothetical protein
MTYDQLKNDAEAIGESNDCAVRTVAVITGKPYKDVHSKFRCWGRKKGRSTPRYMTKCVIDDFGFKLEDVTNKFGSKTVRTLERELPCKGVFLIAVRGHILGARDGQIFDWTQGRLHRIQAVYKVYPSESKR